MKCLNCNIDTNNDKFCSRMCSNKYRWKTGNLRECQTKDRNDKIRRAHTGRKRPESLCKNISKSLKNVKKSKTHCKNLSIAGKACWKNNIDYIAKQKIARKICGIKNTGRWIGDKRPNTSISVKQSYINNPELRKLRALQTTQHNRYYKTSKGVKGIYTSRISKNKELFHSLLELARMLQLDDLNLHWTKKHNIVITYSSNKFYIPDILVDNNLEEIKLNSEINNPIVQEKSDSAIKWCKLNKLNFRFITENDLKQYYNLSRLLKKLGSFKTRLTAGIPLEIKELQSRIEIFTDESFKNTLILGNQQPSSDEEKVQRLSNSILEILKKNESSRVGLTSETPSNI